MAHEIGSFASSSTGNKTINLSTITNPTYIEFHVGPKSGGGTTINQSCKGWSDQTNNVCITSFRDSTGPKDLEYTNRSFAIWDRVSGTMTEILSGTLVSVGTTNFVVNYATAAAGAVNYNVYFIAHT